MGVLFSSDQTKKNTTDLKSKLNVFSNDISPRQQGSNRNLGNQTTQAIAHQKILLGSENDEYEQEADRISEKIVAMSLPPNGPGLMKSSPLYLQRKCLSCAPRLHEDEVTGLHIRRKSKNNAQHFLTADTQSRIDSIRGQGQALPTTVRNYFEPRFDRDLSQVRIQTDSRAALLSQSIAAKAFTLGNDIVFGANQFSPETVSGKKLLAHELTHVLQQSNGGADIVRRQPLTSAAANLVCYNSSVTPPNPSAREPELHPTYEQWLASFVGMSTFTANDTASGHTAANRFTVLGTLGRRYGDRSATAADESVPVTGGRSTGESFIDHPTNQWVINCLPANLRASAYQLPADCADIAVILRHVWLAAHHRTERYNGWVVGDAAGDANQTRVSGLINSVYSGNVDEMVNAYSDTSGDRLLDFTQVSSLLHPGDILVWEHRKTRRRGSVVRARRTGGHTQTITDITRSGSRITDIHVLQGNQPIFSDAATAILQAQGATDTSASSTAGQRLRNLPGRRIESDTAISTANIQDPVSGADIWGSVDAFNTDGSVAEFTVAVAAGPPRAADRPSMRSIGGSRVRRISDWFASLRSASLSRLEGVLEAALTEARSVIDAGNAVSNNDAEQLGTVAGENLWGKATAATRGLRAAASRSSRALLDGDVGSATHFEPLHRMRAAIRALGGIHPAVYRGNPTAATNVHSTFTLIDREFNFAARGGSSISFNRSLDAGAELVKVLVTGFDPFSASPPPNGDWNPAGATALALDNQEVNLGSGNRAAVESVVYPVSFAQFGEGMVERVVRAANADAILTISLNPNVASSAPVQIEQFTVGMHNLTHLQPHRVFPVEPADAHDPTIFSARRGVPGGGNAIIETGAAADLAGIAADTEELNAAGTATTLRPTVASDITFELPSRAIAQQFVTALGLSQTVSSRRIEINQPQAIQTIMANAVRISDLRGLTAEIRVTLNGTPFNVTVIEGPGGSFLSNEVAYRTQRELLAQSSSAVSFHTHVPPADVAGVLIPTSTTRSARRTALWSARETLNRLVTTMRRMIRAVAIRILRQRQQSGGSGP